MLQALPKGPRPHGRRRMLRRGVGLLAVLLGVGFLAYHTGEQNFAMQGLGRALYWVHDVLWLPVKGWVWTRFFPYSLIVCLLALLGFGVWVFRFLTGVPLLRGRHQAWTGWALRKPVLQPLLLWGARRLEGVGVTPEFLRRAVHQEASALLMPWGKEAAAERVSLLARLLEMQENLGWSASADGWYRFETICLWQQGLRVLQLRGLREEQMGRERMLARSEALLQTWLPAYESGSATFFSNSLAVDLWLLRSLDGAVSESRVGVEEVSGALLRRLQDRLRRLEGWQTALARGTAILGLPDSIAGADVAPGRARGPGLDQAMRLFLDLTLECASRLSCPDLAVEVLDRLDELRFALRAGGERIRSQGVEGLTQMLEDVPRAADYGALAALLQRDTAQRQTSSSSSGLVLGDSVWRAAQREQAALLLSSGPSDAEGI